MKKKILCFLLVCIVMVFAAACRKDQNDQNIEVESSVDLYWNVDRDVFVGDSTAGMNSRSVEADGFYSVRFAINGEQITYKVKKARLLEKIDSMDIMGLKIDDQGVITDVYEPDEITGGEVASMYYVVFASDTSITVSADEALEDDYQFFDISENTGIYNVTGMDPVGHTDVAITSDRIRAFVNDDGIITHIFIVERYGYWVGETVMKQCDHCDQEGQWRVWDEKNALPTDSAHWILDNRVMLSAQHKIEANREIILDLNGYTVTGPDSKRVYALTGENAYLAILDSSEGSTGKIVASGSPDNGSVIYIRYGTFELFGGTIDASQIATQQYASAVRVNTDCVFNMYGGTVIGGKVVEPENKETAITNSGYGGTLYVSGTMNLYDGLITGGSCIESGGNIFVGKTGTLNLHGGQVTDGYAAKKGGNIAGTGRVNVHAATVSGGKAEIYGGNFFVGKGGLVTLEDSAALVSEGTAKQGGNIYIENGAAVKVNAGTLQFGHSNAHGGAIAVYGECDLGACTVTGGNAYEQGGNIFVGKTGTLNVNGAVLANGIAGTKGGNIAGTGTVYLNAGQITDGKAEIYGGNIFSGNGATVRAGSDQVTVSGGTAKQGGNAYIEDGAKVTMTAGSVKNGYAIDHGGSIAVYGQCDLGACTVIGGNASKHGGNIFVGKTGTLNVSGATVEGGTAGSKGGNIAGTGAVNLNAGSITGGKAVSYGGNIFSGEGAAVVIGEVTVSGGTAKQGGNAYIEKGAEMTLNAASVKNGEAVAHGGAVAVYGILNINAGVIADNTAKEQGGNIFVGKAGILNVSGATVENGTAGTKGGNIAGTGSINLTDSKILNGSAQKYGGNLFVSGTVQMTGGSIEGGEAVNGGGVAVNGAAFTMTDGVIKGGKATQDGGNIYIARNVDSEGNALSLGSFTVLSGDISGGIATRFGGNVFNGKECTFNLKGGKVLSGTAGQKGGNIAGTGKVNVYAAQVSGGKAEVYGGNFFVGNGGLLTLDDSAALVSEGTAKQGGNIYIENAAAAKINAGTIKLGQSSVHGGSIGVYGECDLGECTVTGGSASEHGGNIFVGKTGTLNVSGATVKNGTAGQKGGNIAGTGKVNVYAAQVSGGKAEVYGGNFFVGNGGLLMLDDDAAQVSGGTAKQGGNAYVENGAEMTVSAGSVKTGEATAHGGAVAVYGVLNINAGVITDNTAKEQGGNIFVGKAGTLNVNGGSIEQGIAGTKGGNIAGTGSINLVSGKVLNGSAQEYGGNLFVSGTVNMTGGSIEGGESVNGGGVAVNGAAFTMTGGIIKGGKATQDGGNLYIARNVDGEGNTLSLGSFTMSAGEISGGVATRFGGNVFNGKECSFTLSGGKVLNGNAGEKGGNIAGTGAVNLNAGAITDGKAVNYGGNIFSGAGAAVVIGDVTVSGGTAKQGGNAYVENGAEMTVSAGSVKTGEATAHGGAVAVYGVLNINAGVITDNTAKEQGGNIFVGKAGTLNVNGGSIEQGIAGTKGGNIAGTGSINLADGKVLNGSAQEYGGNLFVSGTVNMTGGSIEGGESVNGGGVAVNGAAFTMTGGIIKGGKATQDGGNLYIARNVDGEGNTLSLGSFTMSAGEISGGVATRFGGNVFNGKECSFTLSGGKVLNGTAGEKGGNINLTGTGVMEGGTVSGGQSKNGGNINSAGMLEIRGGTIENGVVSNSTKYDRNIFVENGSVILSGGTVAGGVRIKKTTGAVLTDKVNITNDQGFENLTLDKDITVSIGDLTEGAAIGINPASDKFATDAAETDVSCFTCDKNGWDVAYKDGNLILVAGVVEWTSTDSLPTESGMYRLTAPVTITQAASTAKEAQIYLDLNGYTVTGTENTRIYVLNDGATLTVADTSGSSGKIVCTRQSNADAGAIYLKGVRTQFILEGGNIDVSGVTVKSGAAVFVGPGATFKMTGGKITGGTATGNGGNIYVAAQADVYNAGVFEISGGAVENGNAVTGGNVCALGVFRMTGGNITGGTATGNATGGNVYTTPGNNGGSFTMTGGVIDGLVRVNSTGSVSLGGTAKISGGETNLTLSDKPATLETTGFSEGAEIFVNPEYDAFATEDRHFGVIGAEGDEQYIKLDGAEDIEVADSKLYVKPHETDPEEPQPEIIDWTSANSLPTETGKYRLTVPVTVTQAASTAKDAQIYLDLNGQTVTGSNNTRIYVLNEGVSLTVDDTAAGGQIICVRDNTAAAAGAIYLKGAGAEFNLEAGIIDVSAVKVQYGAAVYVAAGTAFYMNGGTVTGGQASETGGNIYVQAGVTAGVFHMNGGTVSDGHAKQGGNIYVAAGSDTNAAAVFHMNGGTVSGGEGTATAGNVAALGVFNMTGGEITGGVCNVTGNHKYAFNLYTLPGKNGCSFTMTGGTVAGGVRVNHAGTITLGGTARITGGITNLTFSVGTMETTGFSEGAEIFVNHAAYGVENAFGIAGVAGDGQYIKADDGSEVAVDAEGSLYLKQEEDQPQPDDATQWTSADSLPSEAGKYRLTQSVTLADTANVAAEVSLDLNGFTVNANNIQAYNIHAGGILTITDSVGTGQITGAGVAAGNGGTIYVSAGGVLNLYSGKISGGQATNGTGGNIYVQAGKTAGVFNMYGGEVTGGKAKQGGNVYLAAGSSTNAAAVCNLYGGTVSNGEGTATAGNVAALGVFHMTGGEITGGICNVTGDHKYAFNLYTLPGKNGCTFTMTGGTIAGGVRVNNDGTVYVGGTAKITGGTTNLTFSKGTIETTIFSEGAEISVNYSAYGVQNSFGTAGVAGDEQYIKADNGSVVAITEGRKLYLVEAE